MDVKDCTVLHLKLHSIICFSLYIKVQNFATSQTMCIILLYDHLALAYYPEFLSDAKRFDM